MSYLSIPSRLIRGEFTPTKLHAMFRSIGTTIRHTGNLAAQSTPESLCDAILHARSPIVTPERMKADARNSLLNALRVEELHSTTVNQHMWIGNPGGLEFIGHSHRLESELDQLHKKLNSVKDMVNAEKASKNTEIALLKKKMSARDKKSASLSASNKAEKASSMVQIAALKKQITAQKRKTTFEKESLDEQIASLSASHKAEKASSMVQIAALKKQITAQKRKTTSEKESLDKQIASLQTKMTAQAKTIATQKTVLELTDTSLGNRLSSVIEGNESYKNMRQRFLSTFKRDYLKEETEADHAIITSGNKSAHGGDATLDATLYCGPGARRDFPVFQTLYGLPPKVVDGIGKYFNACFFF